ncbi:hypothetical protein VP01_4081g1, partial [Puccinia sorghi]
INFLCNLTLKNPFFGGLLMRQRNIIIINYKIKQEIDLINESHQILDWCQEKDDLSDEEAEAAAEILCPISFPGDSEKMKSGVSKYCFPVSNPNNKSDKLVHQKLPQKTKHNYKMKGISVVGMNFNFMANWLKPTKKSSASLNPDQNCRSDDPNPDSPQSLSKEVDPPTVPECLRLDDLRGAKPVKDINVEFKKEHDELNSAIAFLKLEYKHCCLKYTRLNNLKYENQVARVARPVIAASLTAASSSNCHIQTNRKRKNFTSSIYEAKGLRSRANHVLKFKGLWPSHQSKSKKRETLLNNVELVKELKAWAEDQIPGHF